MPHATQNCNDGDKQWKTQFNYQKLNHSWHLERVCGHIKWEPSRLPLSLALPGLSAALQYPWLRYHYIPDVWDLPWCHWCERKHLLVLVRYKLFVASFSKQDGRVNLFCEWWSKHWFHHTAQRGRQRRTGSSGYTDIDQATRQSRHTATDQRHTDAFNSTGQEPIKNTACQ